MRTILAAIALGLCLFGSASAVPATAPGVRTSSAVVTGYGMRLTVRLDETHGIGLLKCTASAPGATSTGISRCTVSDPAGKSIETASGTTSGEKATAYGVGRLGGGTRTACIFAHAQFPPNTYRDVAWCGPLAQQS